MRWGAREGCSRVNKYKVEETKPNLCHSAKHRVTEIRLCFFRPCTFTLQAVVILNKQETYGIPE